MAASSRFVLLVAVLMMSGCAGTADKPGPVPQNVSAEKVKDTAGGDALPKPGPMIPID